MDINREKYTKQIALSELAVGESGRLIEIPADHPLRSRLTDMGWFRGSEIVCVRKSPSADPVAYRTAGVTVALRHGDANRIFVIVDGAREVPIAADSVEEITAEDENGCIPGAYGDYGELEQEGEMLCGETYETAR